ncbi:MAG: MipA/OmpV family protein [Pseudomonadota bacterium]
MLRFHLLPLLIIPVIYAEAARAQSVWDGTLTIAGGATVSNSPYKGGDTVSASAVPYISYEYGGFSIGTEGVSYALIGEEDLTVVVGLSPETSPEYPDLRLYKGLGRDDTALAFAGAEIWLDYGYVEAIVFHDALGAFDGGGGTVKLGTVIDLAPVEIDIGVGALISGSKYNQYRYGVDADEARADRAAFEAKTTLNPFVEVEATYMITDNLAVVGIASYTDLGQHLAKSPLVRNTDLMEAGLFLGYTF